ncbi:hypothetical protein ASF08_17165 [Methylobacterium sp. Leaf85]|nr:hypothetical protein ASF08_17165 [Methylobacterium sp. Leaf85]
MKDMPSSSSMRRQRQQGDVVGGHEVASDVPARAIEDQHGVRPVSTARLISARCSIMAGVPQRGMTKPAPLPFSGQVAPSFDKLSNH